MKKAYWIGTTWEYKVIEFTVTKETNQRYYYDRSWIGMHGKKQIHSEFHPKSECFDTKAEAIAYLEKKRQEKHDYYIAYAKRELAEPIIFTEGSE